MKKRAWAALLLLLLCVCASCLAEEEPVVVVRSSCSIVRSGDYYLVYSFAQVHNNSDDVLCLNEGTFDLIGGDQILSTREVSQLWPYFLSPGQDGYLFDIVPFEPGGSGMDAPVVTGLSYDLHTMRVDAAHASFALNAEARIETDATTGEMMVICEIDNPTQMDAFDPTVTFGLYTAGGDLIYADGATQQSVGIPAGGKMMVRFFVDKAFVEQWRSYQALPASARVSASFRVDED